MDPELRRQVLELMDLGWTDQQIIEKLQDINQPLLRTFRARQLEYIRRTWKEKKTPEQVG